MFGDDGKVAVEAEMQQLHSMGSLEPKNGLIRDERRGALTYLMYLKEKTNGKIKGRGCADGRKQ